MAMNKKILTLMKYKIKRSRGNNLNLEPVEVRVNFLVQNVALFMRCTNRAAIERKICNYTKKYFEFLFSILFTSDITGNCAQARF